LVEKDNLIMQDKRKKIGWFLLFLGVSIILLTLINSYSVVYGKKSLPEFFDSEEQEVISEEEKFSLTEKNVQDELSRLMDEQMKGLFPADSLPKILDLVVWSFLAGIFIFGGAQISNIGIKLIK
jgi:hypothetical protein